MALSDAPKITDWIAAWTGIFGLIVATLALIFTALILRHEIRVRREDQHDLAAAQARLIVSTIELALDVPRVVVRSVRWRVHNYSSAPIVNLRVVIGRRRNRVDLMLDRHAVLEPGGEIDEELGLDEPIVWRVGDSEPPARRLYVVIEFTDAAGLVWSRFGDQPPQRVMPTPTRDPLSVDVRRFVGLPLRADK